MYITTKINPIIPIIPIGPAPEIKSNKKFPKNMMRNIMPITNKIPIQNSPLESPILISSIDKIYV